ncbi:MAG: diguanylate cyclase [Spirochaetes bacterium]|nr:MAG: diguanylate cyclase [Spirochaetota bacterium]
MSEANENPDTQIEPLRAGFVAALPEKVAQIERLWHLTRTGGSRSSVDSLKFVAKRFADSAGVLGFSELSASARSIEAVLGTNLESKSPLGDAEVRRIEEYLEELRGALGRATGMLADSPWGNYEQPLWVQEYENRMIYLLEHAAGDSGDLTQQIAVFGYMVAVFHTLESMGTALRKVIPGAILIDTSFLVPGGDRDSLHAHLSTGDHAMPPIVFISQNGDMSVRLDTVRNGGSAFFVKPVDVSELIDTLDLLTSDRRQDPFRVLIVEDNFEQAQFYSVMLHEAGIFSSFLTNPLEIMKPLVEFQPELILMDLSMPGCNGLELASVIRQQEAFVSIPIVFFSASPEFRGFGDGIYADEVIPKTIAPARLIASVQSKVQRYRTLRSFMERDSLTGLLKHSRIKEQLQIEVDRARRQNSILSFAMIDIDRFKEVNDTHGHLTGDRVLKSLSRLLRERLRRIDMIGRYGGEEFAVILPNTRAEDAVKIMDDIRESFGMIRQKSDTGDFRVTFSCGIAAYPLANSALNLNERADRALYVAKDRGRNCVVLSDHPDEPG